jgi:hypothetical protein
MGAAAMESQRRGLCVNHAYKLTKRPPVSQQLSQQCNWNKYSCVYDGTGFMFILFSVETFIVRWTLVYQIY